MAGKKELQAPWYYVEMADLILPVLDEAVEKLYKKVKCEIPRNDEMPDGLKTPADQIPYRTIGELWTTLNKFDLYGYDATLSQIDLVKTIGELRLAYMVISQFRKEMDNMQVEWMRAEAERIEQMADDEKGADACLESMIKKEE